MNIGIRLVVFCLIALLASCGLIKEKRAVAVSETYTDLNQAVSKVPTLIKLNSGDALQIAILEEVSPRLTRGEFTDYFEIVEVDGVEGRKFSLALHAMCDCLGFRKWAILSDVYLIDPSGKQIDLKASGLQSRYVGGVFEKTGLYKFVIVASSKYQGQTMGKIEGYLDGANPATAISLPLTVHPTGTIKLEYK